MHGFHCLLLRTGIWFSLRLVLLPFPALAWGDSATLQSYIKKGEFSDFPERATNWWKGKQYKFSQPLPWNPPSMGATAPYERSSPANPTIFPVTLTGHIFRAGFPNLNTNWVQVSNYSHNGSWPSANIVYYPTFSNSSYARGWLFLNYWDAFHLVWDTCGEISGNTNYCAQPYRVKFSVSFADVQTNLVCNVYSFGDCSHSFVTSQLGTGWKNYELQVGDLGTNKFRFSEIKLIADMTFRVFVNDQYQWWYETNLVFDLYPGPSDLSYYQVLNERQTNGLPKLYHHPESFTLD